MPQDTVPYVRELERRDRELAASLETIARRWAQVRAIGERAERLSTFAARLPRDRAAAAHAVARREAELDSRRRELAEAEQAAADRRRSDPALEAAATRARVAVERAEEELASARARAGDLERDADHARQDSHALVLEAGQSARELASAPRMTAHVPEPPAAGLDGVIEWVARATPALLLARSGLDAERETVVREANELAAAVLGGALAPSGVAQIRDRVEQLLEAESVPGSVPGSVPAGD